MRRTYQLYFSLAGGLALILLGLISPGLSVAQDGCTSIYPLKDGWAIDMCPTDPVIITPMSVTLDGVLQGTAALVRIYRDISHLMGVVRTHMNADER